MSTVLNANLDAKLIAQQLQANVPLVLCMCASWCTACDAWQDQFAQLAREQTDKCFVWLDIEEHPDMVAEVDLDTLPVLLHQTQNEVYFLGTIEPRQTSVKRLLSASSLAEQQDPGIHEFLIENAAS